MLPEPNAFTKQILLDTLSEVLKAQLKANHKFKQMMKNLGYNLNDLIRGPDLLLSDRDKIEKLQKLVEITDQLMDEAPSPIESYDKAHPIKINPTQEKLDIDDLELCFNNQIYLTPKMQEFITDNFKSRKENAVIEFSAPITPKMRLYLDKILYRIKREEKNTLTYTASVAD